MKGVVFTEFIEFTEEEYGFDTADEIVVDENGEDRIFTQGGNYEFEELVALVVSLHKISGDEVNLILFKFGKYLFGRLAKMASFLLKDAESSLELIEKVDTYIHIEVNKLYPDADLPKFRVISKDTNYLEMEYESEKRLEEFGKGLMVGCANYFNETLEINYESKGENPHVSIFKIKKVS
jgi:hypothetical protein